MGQLLLIPDPRPLDQRLGREFFRAAPHRPGVYLMKDTQDRIVYVGKAKDLQQRLNHYRIANPDRMKRRHLRLVNAVSRIEFQFCATEAAALRHEKKLIRSLKPKFNRAGVWPGRPKFIVWRATDEALEISVMETPAAGWRRFGPLGAGTVYLQRSLARLLWLAVNAGKSFGEMPAGWVRGEFMEATRIHCGAMLGEVRTAFEGFFWSDTADFLPWLEGKFSQRTNAFERLAIETELEGLREFTVKCGDSAADRRQLVLL